MKKSNSMMLLAFALLSSAANAQELTGAEATSPLEGRTTYLELPDGPRGTGSAVIFYDDERLSPDNAQRL